MRGDYLMWWTQAMSTPALVTTSPADTDRDDAGVLGQPGTEVLFGKEGLIDGLRSGGRIRFGGWLDGCQIYGLEGEYFGLANQSDDFYATSEGDPILRAPFVNALTDLQDAELVAYPDLISGSVTTGASSTLNSAGARLRLNLLRQDGCECGTDGSRLDLLVGYRFLGLSEGISVREQLTSLDPLVSATFDIRDSFDARSDFHGGEMGLLCELRRSRWSVEVLAKVALGNSHQVVTINGSTDRVISDEPDSLTGGFLAQRTNIGRFDEDQFAVVPEAGVTLSCELTRCIKATFGYSFLYLSSVARAANQIDPDVNPNLLPPESDPFFGPLRPAFAPDDTGFWAQGLAFGLEWRR